MSFTAHALLSHRAPAALLLASCAASVNASLNFNPVPPSLNRSANLVTNGSFEIGAPTFGTSVFWATGATGGPSVIPGWSSTGTPSTYATWGSSGVPGQGIRGSAPFPDGHNGVYFGNLSTDVSVAPTIVNGKADVAPTFLPSGRVTFPTAPIFTPSFGGPCILSQTINTQFTPAPMYQMTFWVSGEDAVSQGTWSSGVMGFRMTNVLPGDPIQYLTIPSGLGGLQSALYAYNFVPLNPLLPVTIEFINWGHISSVGGVGVPFTSELVLDDVIINAVPAPGTAALLTLGGVLAGRRRRLITG